jgi:hypothetical protein
MEREEHIFSDQEVWSLHLDRTHVPPETQPTSSGG